MTTNGVMIRSSAFGMIFLSFFSSFAPISAVMIAVNTLPWHPTIGIFPNATTADIPLSGFATEYAFGRIGETNIRPSTIPMTGVPPNTLKADQQMIAGRNANAVSVSTFTNVTI